MWLVTELPDHDRLEQLALVLLKFQNEPRLQRDVLKLQQQAQVVEAQTAVVLVVVAKLHVPVAVHVLYLLQEVVAEDALELPAKELREVQL